MYEWIFLKADLEPTMKGRNSEHTRSRDRPRPSPRLPPCNGRDELGWWDERLRIARQAGALMLVCNRKHELWTMEDLMLLLLLLPQPDGNYVVALWTNDSAQHEFCKHTQTKGRKMSRQSFAALQRPHLDYSVSMEQSTGCFAASGLSTTLSRKPSRSHLQENVQLL